MTVVESAPFRISASPAPVELLAKYFRALGDETRLRILELLGERDELSVSELVEGLGLPQPQISKHLACLRWCGFVATRRQHRSVYYRRGDERIAELIQIARALLAENAEHVAICGAIEGGQKAAAYPDPT